MRSFLAIDIPQQTRKRLEDIQKKFHHLDLDAKWINPENLHMTLKFLGEITETRLEDIKTILHDVACDYQSFAVNTREFGFFPDDRKPKIFFITTDQEQRLSALALKLEERLTTLGFTKENRFKPHITLARIKSAKNISNLKKAFSGVDTTHAFLIEGMTLYKSILKNSGPAYEVILKENFKNCNIALA